jgi:hypothetical protein
MRILAALAAPRVATLRNELQRSTTGCDGADCVQLDV